MADPPTKLLILTPSHAVHGGVESLIDTLAQGLPGAGIDVTVGLARGARFHDPSRYREAHPSLQCVEVDGRSGTREGRVQAILECIRRVDPHVVLVARMAEAYYALAELKSRGAASRVMMTIDAFEPEYLADLRRFSGWIDGVVAGGKLIARAAERFASMPAGRVFNIPPGVSPPLSPATPRRHQRPLLLGYAGRLEQNQKRILDLPTVLEILTRRGIDWTCTIAGTGPEESHLRDEIHGRNLDSRVRFEGWLPKSELYGRIYPALDVFLHFAAWEGITIAPREAMAHGAVPVISRFTGAVAEGHYRDKVNCLTFDVGDVEGAADCVARLDASRELLATLSANAMTSQEGIWSVAGSVAAWAEAIRTIIALPVRAEAEVPRFRGSTGRLSSLGVPPETAERMRRLLRRAHTHDEPGSEWPHCTGDWDPAWLEDIRAFGKDE